jgi:hypothetical protein
LKMLKRLSPWQDGSQRMRQVLIISSNHSLTFIKSTRWLL